ncbi:MAG: fibronectin [candidate division KSB1 bacterium]|nr:fibronectin [candidate division KSB1 bacterium]
MSIRRQSVWLSAWLVVLGLWMRSASELQAQVEATEKRYVRIGSLQSHFSAYGSERAWNNKYYEGLIWPADYPYQDNAVIKRAWIGVMDFTDEKGRYWERYGIYFAADYVGQSLFPVELKQTAKFPPPVVYVDGYNITAPYAGDVDEIDPEQIPDRIITNVVNTSMGLTLTRRILVFSQQYHDNYFIKIFTFTNTGNTDYDDEIELNATLKGVRISWGVRYSVCREGAFHIGGTQSWGQHMWVTKRGENYAQHVNDRITEANPIVDWLRCGFGWAGQNAKNAFDNIGGPAVKLDGRLTAPQHAGIVVLHVDKSPEDRSDDSNQPIVLGWHAGDTYPSLGDMSPQTIDKMKQLYSMLSGNPHQGLGGNERFDEKYMASNSDPYTVHNDAGGTNIWICYGPWDLAPGESITIVEAEGVAGLSRQMCEKIGRRWKKAYDDPTDKGPFPLPDGGTTTDKDEFKNAWVYTGKDSILLTFGRAKRNYDAGYQIPQPPLPPPLFEVTSGGDRIFLRWSPSPSEGEPDFAGYKIFRAVGKPDTTFEEIYTAMPGETEYEDTEAERGKAYYYYIVAFNDGSNNTTGETNPTGPLYSSRFYTKTNQPAYLRRQAGESLAEIRVVPNPFNVRARDLQYPGEPDKIMFLNIPAKCIIRIYTVRGDLIQTIHHTDGSGDEVWNSVTSSRQVVVSGVYIAHFTVTEDYRDPETGELKYRKGDTAIRKFVIIR